MATNTTSEDQALQIEPITQAADVAESFHCACEAFGRQAQDAIWMGMNPGWDTPEGKARGAERMVARWRSTTRDDRGNPNTVFLKATLPGPRWDDEGQRVIAGLAIWVQASVVEGRGDAPSDDLGKGVDLEALYPGDEAEQRYVSQIYRSLVRRRVEVVQAKAEAKEDPPSVMVLDLCAVGPAFQRRGIASKLVRWGLDEAKRRGIPEATTEASSMGRHVYERLGFRGQGPDIVYDVDSEFLERDRPPNVFMRTGGS